MKEIPFFWNQRNQRRSTARNLPISSSDVCRRRRRRRRRHRRRPGICGSPRVRMRGCTHACMRWLKQPPKRKKMKLRVWTSFERACTWMRTMAATSSAPGPTSPPTTWCSATRSKHIARRFLFLRSLLLLLRRRRRVDVGLVRLQVRPYGGRAHCKGAATRGVGRGLQQQARSPSNSS